MRKSLKFFLFVMSLILTLLLGELNPASASSWSADSLPAVTDASKFRGLFAPLPFFSINDDYSFNVTREDQSYPIFSALLVPCSESNVKDSNYKACISNLQYRRIGSTKWNDGSVANTQLNSNPTKTIKGASYVAPFEYDAASLRPQGGFASIWELSGANHLGGNKYLIRATISSPGADQISYVDGGLQRLIRVQVIPIAFQSNGKSISQSDYTIENFPTGFEFRLKLQLGVFLKSLSGWYFGRLQDPDFNSNIQNGFLEVTAQPARIPIGLTDLIDIEAASKIVHDCPKDLYCGSTSMLWGKYSIFDSEERINPEILAEFEKIGSGVRTVSTSSLWGFDSTRLGEAISVGTSSAECLQEINGKGARVFLGAVSSNATMFQTTAPTWNPEEKSFSFKVASPHLDENLKPNQGTYTLSIPESQAICRWGTDAIGARAEIEILNSDGTSRVTTVSSELKNGLLVFNVSGFGYSNPTIKISLGRLDRNSQPSTSPKPQAKQISITCIKGKLTKKVTALNPKCPVGYKKK